MEEKQLDFNAPLLSVRRNATKTEPRTITVGNPGEIPFTWEDSPGKPKGGISIGSGRRKAKEEGVDDALFEETVEMLSSNDSSYYLSDFGSSDGSENSESFLKDVEIHDLIMRRFLPAAIEMTTGPLKTSPSRQSESLPKYRQPVSLPYQHRPKVVSRFAYNQEMFAECSDEEEEEEGYEGGRHVFRGCCLIPRFFLKGSFLLLNPVPGMKLRNQLPVGSQITVSDHESVGRSEDELWEAVYRYKVGLKENPLRDDESKMTSESNQLTYWSDSQTADETSYQQSPQSPFGDGKGFPGVPVRKFKGSRKTVSFDFGEIVNGSYAKEKSSLDPTLCVDSDTLQSSKPSSVDCRRIEDYHISDVCGNGELKTSISDADNSQKADLKGTKFNKKKSGDCLALSLPPLPSPRAPSESWLQRTLPSKSAKSRPESSIFGIQVQHKKQFSLASSYDFRRVSTKPA